MHAAFSGFYRPLRLQLPLVLSFFRSNQFFIAFLLALYVILVHSGALLGYVQPVGTSTEGGLLYHALFGWTAGQPFFAAAMATLLVFVQAVSVNALADECRLMGERNWFPGLFYALTVSALPEFLFVSAPLAALTFVPFSLWRIFNAYQKPNMTAAIFDGALWIAVASLFFPPVLFLSVAAFAGFGVVRVFRLNERFVFLIGTVVPLFLAWLWYFWLNKGGEFRDIQWGNLIQWCRFGIVWELETFLKIGLLVLFGFGFLIGIGSQFGRKGNQTQKFVGAMYWFLAIGGLIIFFRKEWRWENLLLPSVVIGILLALTFQNFRNKLWAEVWHLIFLIAVFFVQFSDYLLPIFSFQF